MAPRTSPLAGLLELRAPTPETWCAQACQDLPGLLNDHAHLERKAATNALALLNRWPETDTAATGGRAWVRALAAIAADEARHLVQVLAELERVGGTLSPMHTNTYAGALRAWVRRGDSRGELLDRLLVSGLIEARSCDRFLRLADGAPTPRLRRFYATLARSEAGHHQAFVRIALDVCPEDVVRARAQVLCAAEHDIIHAQPPGSRLHSGVA